MFLKEFIYSYFWLCWIFLGAHEVLVPMHGLSVVAASGVYSLVASAHALENQLTSCGTWP